MSSEIVISCVRAAGLAASVRMFSPVKRVADLPTVGTAGPTAGLRVRAGDKEDKTDEVRKEKDEADEEEGR